MSILVGSVLIWLGSSPAGPSALHKSGHFYFAQTGHSHFAATSNLTSLTCLLPST